VDRCYAPKSPHATLDVGKGMRQGQLTCRTPLPTAASTQAVIVEIFASRSTGPIPSRLSGSAPVAAAYVLSTGPAWTSHADGRFCLQIADDSRMTRYRFGTKTADFHVCLTCGVIPIVTCTIEGIRYAVVNVNTFDDGDRSQLVETATNFEGEATENRLDLARRRRNWTPEAVDSEGGDSAGSH
jgi:hypothetical protein